MTKFKATKNFIGNYTYRGFVIDAVPTEAMNGSTAFWTITPPGESDPSDAANTLRDAKDWVDHIISLDF